LLSLVVGSAYFWTLPVVEIAQIGPETGDEVARISWRVVD
jgi:hypothetical protein